jgi:tRNA (uracil-5-)-methyltransferase
LTEALGRCKFEISPGAFFQVNTGGAELLYGIAIDKVRSAVKNPEKTVLFDVCCGTGTIGLTCMKENVVGRVVGVDISAPAIANAKRNAAINGYETDLQDSKVRFVAERAEKALYNEIKQNLGSGLDFVALVDPARAGLHADVAKTIRSTEEIKRLVYVSCNPTGTLVHDAGLLCSPPTKKYKGTPFTIVSATPVDMFPFTDHCEMVMVFDRMDSSNAEASLREPEVTGDMEDGSVQSTAIPESN